jgi:glyoxylase-like metal-dependent hydrolase (beta-lactamase superfamily II)
MGDRNRLLNILKRMDTRPIDEDVHLIVGENSGTFPYSNSLLIMDEEVVLIDSGLGDERVVALSDHVDILINSHYHIDHILGNHLFEELWVIDKEAGVTSSFDNYKHYAGILDTPIESEWLSWFYEHFSFHPSSFSRIFKPNETFNFGNSSWRALHTPGHSPGHCVFYEPGRKIMFSSDVDLTPFGPWYGNPNANLKDLIQSIELILDYDIGVICSSHSFPQRTSIKEDIRAYLNTIYERDESILRCLEKQMTLDDLESQNIIYKESQKRYKAFAWFEKKMIEKHLDMLIEGGKVERVGDFYKAL